MPDSSSRFPAWLIIGVAAVMAFPFGWGLGLFSPCSLRGGNSVSSPQALFRSVFLEAWGWRSGRHQAGYAAEVASGGHVCVLGLRVVGDVGSIGSQARIAA